MGKARVCTRCGVGLPGSGKCCTDTCAEGAVRDCIKQLRDKKGPVYDKWKKNLEEKLKQL